MKLEQFLKKKFIYTEKKNLIKYLYYLSQRFFRKKNIKKSYSFGGIDLLINYLFKNKKDGIYIDVGCYHPFKGNNTFLLHKNGWRGINIDIDFNSIEMFNFFRPNDYNQQVAISDKVGETDLFFYHNKSAINTLSKEIHKFRGGSVKEIKRIKTDTLDNIIESSPYKKEKINFLSIDVEGYEMEVLKGFNLNKYSPDVIVIEYIDTTLKKLEFHNQKIENVINSELFKYIKFHNYHLVNWLHSDLVFIHDSIRE